MKLLMEEVNRLKLRIAGDSTVDDTVRVFGQRCEHQFTGYFPRDDADMILVQWGPMRDWNSNDDPDDDKEQLFEFDLVRQLVDSEQDSEPVQLHVSIRFPHEAAEGLDVKEGNFWSDPITALTDIESCHTFKVLRLRKPTHILIWAEEC